MKWNEVLIDLRKRLYVYVAAAMVLASTVGMKYSFSRHALRVIGWLSVFIMLYPMLTGLAVERVVSAVKRPWLIGLALTYAFIIASLTAYLVSHTILEGYPELAFALAMVGAIPCSNMLIGWTGIAGASVEDALVVAVSGLLLTPLVSPILLSIVGGVFIAFDSLNLGLLLLTYILVPLFLGFLTRRYLMRRLGGKGFVEVKKYLPGISATGVLLIVFVATARVAKLVMSDPEILVLVVAGLFSYYIIQTLIALITIRVLKLSYEYAVILLLASVASSQAISLSVAASMFPPLTVFALSMKPLLQVLYILFLIYTVAPLIAIWDRNLRVTGRQYERPIHNIIQ
ncbi:MAG: hypothetical protein F7B59_05585 [Desulfurococcales archaeon]|nr:hypothetical protein [Desulfurococcales archaeon]